MQGKELELSVPQGVAIKQGRACQEIVPQVYSMAQRMHVVSQRTLLHLHAFTAVERIFYRVYCGTDVEGPLAGGDNTTVT